MNKHGIKAYLISLGIDNAVWNIQQDNETIYFVDANSNMIALIPEEIIKL